MTDSNKKTHKQINLIKKKIFLENFDKFLLIFVDKPQFIPVGPWQVKHLNVYGQVKI